MIDINSYNIGNLNTLEGLKSTDKEEQKKIDSRIRYLKGVLRKINLINQLLSENDMVYIYDTETIYNLPYYVVYKKVNHNKLYRDYDKHCNTLCNNSIFFGYNTKYSTNNNYEWLKLSIPKTLYDNEYDYYSLINKYWP
jgi:hypothetical protein